VRLFCFGLGFTALTLARRLRAEGWEVAGTCRSAGKQARLAAEGFASHLFDRGRPLDEAGLAALAAATHVLSSVPPDATGDPVLDHHAAALARTRRRWVGYLSTTGVYGDRDGGRVDEETPPVPSGERGRRRVAAERRWLALQSDGVPVHVFRLAGIYGPGRNVLETVRAGTAKRIDKPGHLFSRIHVEDIATVLAASIAKPHPGRIYNLCDDDPAPPAEVTEFACALLAVEPPPLVPFEVAARTMSPMALSFWDDDRRVSNRRIKQELGVSLRYPDYRAGLAALAATMRRDG
jgi:nucleoside-diphosphate-sugar epimerase